MRKITIAIALLFLVAIAACYLGSPYWAAHSLEEAARSGDADRIAMLTDMPAIREGLKAQISTAVTRKINANSNSSPFAALGALIAPAIIGKVIDAYVTPDGVANILKNGKPVTQQSDPSAKEPQYTAQDEYLGLDRFRVRLHDKNSGEEGPALVFERRGFVTWQLIRIDLPANAFEDLALPGSRAPDQP